MNEIRIIVKGEDQSGTSTLKAAGDAADDTSKKVDGLNVSLDANMTASDRVRKSTDEQAKSHKKAADESENAARKTAELRDRTDDLDESSSHATSALGALGSGFELIGQTGIQTTLESAALATDFFSGVGEGATLIVDKFKGGLEKAKGALGSFGEQAKDGSTKVGTLTRNVGAAVLAVAAMQVAFNAIGSDINPQVEALVQSFTNLKKGTEQSGESARIFGDDAGKLDTALKDIADTGRWSTFARGFGGAIESVTGAGQAFDDSIQHSKERLTALDDALSNLVAKGRGDEAAQIFQQVADRAKEQGVSVNELNSVLPKYAAAAKNATGATKDNAKASQDAAAAAKNQADEVTAVSDALKAQTDPLFAIIDGQKTYDDATKSLNDAIKKHGKNSAEAADASLALDKATIGLVSSLGKASSGTGHLTDEQKQLLWHAGVSAARIKTLDDRLYAAWKQAQKLDNFNIDINYSQHFRTFGKPYSQAAIDSGNIGGLASGGVKGAASGPVSTGLTWTGEAGPELLDLPAGTTVHSAGDSQRMMTQGTPAGGGGAVNVVLSFDKAGMSSLAAALMETLRAEIRHEGGNVQTVLGVPGR